MNFASDVDFDYFSLTKSLSEKNVEKGMKCSICETCTYPLQCVSCSCRSLQQRRTALAALKADVAVLRRKSANIMDQKSMGQEDTEWINRMQYMERLKCEILQERQKLWTFRIELEQKQEKISQQHSVREDIEARIDAFQQYLDSLRQPVLEGLEKHISWHEISIRKVRRARIHEIYTLFSLRSEVSSSPIVASICGIPLPRSGLYQQVPLEVVSAALGRVIHLLMLLQRYIPITYPYIMQYNSSFSTIGDISGQGCHTLYPDGSVGFDRGLELLQQNVKYLCLSQGMSEQQVWPMQDILGNLIRLQHCPTLGRSPDDTIEAPSQKQHEQPTIDHYIKDYGAASSCLSSKH